jgi:hypothetical protein
MLVPEVALDWSFCFDDCGGWLYPHIRKVEQMMNSSSLLNGYPPSRDRGNSRRNGSQAEQNQDGGSNQEQPRGNEGHGKFALRQTVRILGTSGGKCPGFPQPQHSGQDGGNESPN